MECFEESALGRIDGLVEDLEDDISEINMPEKWFLSEEGINLRWCYLRVGEDREKASKSAKMAVVRQVSSSNGASVEIS